MFCVFLFLAGYLFLSLVKERDKALSSVLIARKRLGQVIGICGVDPGAPELGISLAADTGRPGPAASVLGNPVNDQEMVLVLEVVLVDILCIGPEVITREICLDRIYDGNDLCGLLKLDKLGLKCRIVLDNVSLILNMCG